MSLIIYNDFQCALCARLAGTMDELLLRHPGDIQYVYRLYPLITINDKSGLAGQAVWAAGRQDAFWEMHDLLYDEHEVWSSLAPSDFEGWLVERADSIGLETQEFTDDLQSNAAQEIVLSALQDALSAGVPGAPFIFLNGSPFRLAPSPSNLEAAVRLELLAERQFDAYPPMDLDVSASYTATLVLESGEVVIRLLPDSAPMAVNSFVYLSNEGWFDGNPFFLVDPDSLVQSGDPSGTGLGGPGYHFPTEIDPALSFDRPGMVALASAGPGANGSQFFISLAPLPRLDGTRTIFGRVLRGMDLLEELDARDPLEDLLEPGLVRILSVRIDVE